MQIGDPLSSTRISVCGDYAENITKTLADDSLTNSPAYQRDLEDHSEDEEKAEYFPTTMPKKNPQDRLQGPHYR